jgi:hypothetical protein
LPDAAVAPEPAAPPAGWSHAGLTDGADLATSPVPNGSVVEGAPPVFAVVGDDVVTFFLELPWVPV